MRQAFIATADFVLCQSDTGDGGWSIHAPGSTDDQIASGEALALVSGDRFRPETIDYLAAVELYAPWAAQVEEVEGGFHCFESVADYETWKRQV